ncbi:MAG TPA: ATP-binding protein [Cytophagales bacterium]|nr:ATP-binding protein [Cytophagales bacterium]HAA22309.1 ATP-binding protein [Cytophagales bacterium]HAP60478.1 ATP-binding protein [Cytophagales bacterium]
MRNRFTLFIVLRLLGIIGGSLLFVELWGNIDLIFTRMLLFLILIAMVSELIRFLNRTNQELSKFLNAIEYEDGNVHFSLARLGGSFKDLETSFKQIVQAIQQAKIEKEAQLGFLQVLLEQIPVGVLAVREGEAIELMNRQAADLLHTTYTKRWSYLRRVRPEFCDPLDQENIPSQQTIHIQVGSQSHSLVVNHHTMRMLEVNYTLITLQDIGPEMERQELEAWQKLIRILTHEIMNSITPLSSLTETLLLMLHTPEGNPKGLEDLRQDDLDDIRYSIDTIRDRSSGLMRFVEDYRRLYKVPNPIKQNVEARSFLNNLTRLLGPQLQAAHCEWRLEIDPQKLTVHFDESLVQQVFINLITNALQAMEGQPAPTLVLKGYARAGQTIFTVTDSGPGIPEDKLDKIFIPFFTTKAKGSGIGLSLSRQIIFQHGGQLTGQNLPEGGAQFSLTFPRNNT